MPGWALRWHPIRRGGLPSDALIDVLGHVDLDGPVRIGELPRAGRAEVHGHDVDLAFEACRLDRRLLTQSGRIFPGGEDDVDFRMPDEEGLRVCLGRIRVAVAGVVACRVGRTTVGDHLDVRALLRQTIEEALLA